MLSRETNFHRRRLFWPQFTQDCRIWQATLWERFSPNRLNGWNWLPWMKAITIDSLNICIFSFVSFSSMVVMLIPRGTPYIFEGEVHIGRRKTEGSSGYSYLRCNGISHDFIASAWDTVPISDNLASADEQIEARDEINEAIKAVFAEQPFSSIKNINKMAIFLHQPLPGD
jgi:hypothetical protein